MAACDMHPDYHTTLAAREFADEAGISLYPVQHHHAHIAACMSENLVEGEVIGLALDGTGWGTDGAVWGGEVLRVAGPTFERLGNFAPVALPGGNMAAREPWRMAVSYLFDTFGDEFREELPEFVDRIGGRRVELLVEMIRKGINSPRTTSCGRLFDAVASLAGVRDISSYEGQAPCELEGIIDLSGDNLPNPYNISVFRDESGSIRISFRHLFREIVDDLRKGERPEVISARFHAGLVDGLVESVRLARDITGLSRVALSGGVFQNRSISVMLERRLTGLGFEVFRHCLTPPNDGCISLGQAMVAGSRFLEE
ncbi:hypothetical protein ACFL1X_00885 [Candidatus Hydrogenedentota bacterium]